MKALLAEDDLADVVALMLNSEIRSVPVLDDGVPVGIASRRDVLGCVARREPTSDDVRRRPIGSRPATDAEPTQPGGVRT